MRILVFYQYFGTPKGGWSTRYYEFTRRWVSRGHQVTVITSPYYKSDIRAKGFIHRQTIEGVELIVINSPDSNKDSFFKRAWNALRFALVSVYFALTEPTDCVISSSGPITTAIPGLLAKILRRKKFVFEVRDLWPKGGIELGKLQNGFIQKLALKFEKLIYRNSDLIVTCSPGMTQGVLDVLPSANTLTISNSADLDLFKPNSDQASSSELPLFIYAGSLGLMDDCSQILNGLHLLKRKDYRFKFIGDGAEKPLLIQLVDKYGLKEQVEFLGLIPKVEVVKWFAQARASLVTFKDLPVLHTNSPNKLFDSLSAGVPVIQSTKGWIFEMVNETQCGINVDPQSPHDFAKAFELMIDFPEEAERMGKNARQLAENRFDRSKLSEEYIKAMESL